MVMLIKPHNQSRKGMTLVELLVASVMVGVFLFAVFAVDFAIRSSRTAAAVDVQVAMRAWAAMEEITRNAKQAVGDSVDPGVMFSTISNFLCFRRDTAITPEDYSDDIWVCYSKFNNQIVTCNKAGAAACLATDRVIGSYATEIPCASDCDLFVYDVVEDPVLKQFYVAIALTDRIDPASAPDTMTNPDYSLQTRIYPEGQSY